MLRLPDFDFLAPRSLAEVVTVLSEAQGDARVVAGGTDLWPNMKRRHQSASSVISLMHIEELSLIEEREDGLHLGAACRLGDLEDDPRVRSGYPALAAAIASISSPPLRNMGTLGGNLCLDTRCTYYNQTEDWRRSISYCMKEQGDICWVATSSPRCWAHSASDSAPVLAALGASVKLLSKRGVRWLPVSELYRNDGIAYLAKERDEILTEILLPAEAATPLCRSSFWKLRRRGSIDFAVLSVAAAVWLDQDEETVSRAAIVLGAVASQPATATAASEALIGRHLDEEAISDAATLVRKAITPMDNTDFQPQWRGAVAGRYAAGALREIAGLPVERLLPRQPLLASSDLS
ncbi:MAG TPA: FAD binding domain-containing protein [Thermoanaerobaculia bacterium]|nr:FAD binding domain-containing protein [Thermoanaerobaculia bacterium]